MRRFYPRIETACLWRFYPRIEAACLWCFWPRPTAAIKLCFKIQTIKRLRRRRRRRKKRKRRERDANVDRTTHSMRTFSGQTPFSKQRTGWQTMINEEKKLSTYPFSDVGAGGSGSVEEWMEELFFIVVVLFCKLFFCFILIGGLWWLSWHTAS